MRGQTVHSNVEGNFLFCIYGPDLGQERLDCTFFLTSFMNRLKEIVLLLTSWYWGLGNDYKVDLGHRGAFVTSTC